MYKVVVAKSRPRLQDKVRALMEKGWQPLGGVAVERDPVIGKRRAFFQAMVKTRSA
jgi:hypothetical protein